MHSAFEVLDSRAAMGQMWSHRSGQVSAWHSPRTKALKDVLRRPTASNLSLSLESFSKSHSHCYRSVTDFM